ncbi:MAG: hypothetical protein AAF413_00715 [Patescibacteria group bacterium]
MIIEISKKLMSAAQAVESAVYEYSRSLDTPWGTKIEILRLVNPQVTFVKATWRQIGQEPNDDFAVFDMANSLSWDTRKDQSLEPWVCHALALALKSVNDAI